MPDTLEALSKLAKAHAYFGKAQALNAQIDKITKAAKTDPKNTSELRKLVGLIDGDAVKLSKVLEARMKATEEAAKTSYPEIKTKKDALWAKWAAAIGKHGQGSREAERARSDYIKELKAYEKAVNARILDCGIHAKQSTKQAKVYAELAKAHAFCEKLCEKILTSGVVIDGRAAPNAFRYWHQFTGVGTKASRISKAHDTIVNVANAEAAKMKKEKASLSVWMKDIKAKQANNNLKRAFKALGVAV